MVYRNSTPCLEILSEERHIYPPHELDFASFHTFHLYFRRDEDRKIKCLGKREESEVKVYRL